ncbi:MAG: cell division protein SepF [Actinobacteria bacterium]|nr:cell division protein SepF [Actinomycetota bacterium]
MSMFRRAMDYLGLGPDDAYDDYDASVAVLNIGSADSEVARRLLDFTSGLIYGMQGTMEKVSPGVFLIKPFGASSPRG